MGKKLASGLDPQAHAEDLPGEILVSRNLDKVEFVHRPGIDVVDDAKRVRSGFLVELDGGIKVAAALEIVEQVALSLIQKIVIESVFFIHWNFFFQRAPADVKTLRVNDDHRPRL